MDKCTKSGLSFDEAVWNTHLSAESWEMDHQFDWDDIMSDNDKLGFLVFNKSGDMIQTKFENEWLISLLGFLLFSLILSFFLKSLSLVFLGLWSVLREELEKLVSLISLKSVGELVDSTWD